MTAYPALALIEVSSIARGMVVTDACVKKAVVTLLSSRPLAPGKYITLFWGEVAEVEEAYQEGVRTAAETLVDSLFLPGAHTVVLETLAGIAQPSGVDSIGIVETFAVSSTLLSADAACKAAEVDLLEVRLATGLGGKAYYLVSGRLHDVEAAVEAGIAAVTPEQLVRTEIIPRPAPDFTDFVW